MGPRYYRTPGSLKTMCLPKEVQHEQLQVVSRVKIMQSAKRTHGYEHARHIFDSTLAEKLQSIGADRGTKF